MIFYVYLIVSHFLPNLVGGRLEGFDTQKNSTYSSLMDKYRPIQVKCTKSDCDFAQAAMDNNIYLDPSKNYFNDGFRNCNADICSTIYRQTSTMTQIDASGGYFKDNSGNYYDYLGNSAFTKK